MRVLIHGFYESTRSIEDAEAMLRRFADVELVGWVARRRFQRNFTDSERGYPLFDEPISFAKSAPLGVDPLLSLHDAVADENLRYLLDREKHYADHYELTLWRSEIVCWAQEILERSRPEVVLYADVPHSGLSYALYLAARERGIKVLALRFGPVPHLITFSDGFDAPLYEFVSSGLEQSAAPLSTCSTEYLDRLSGTYERAAPAYMREQLAHSSLASLGFDVLRRRPRELFGRDTAGKALANVRRRQLRKKYEERTEPVESLGENFVALFLHLQPERSTSPTGGVFAQQWLVAHAIAAALPPGWSLGVREHPSTFLSGPRLVRDAGFYDALQRIPGVRLISTSVDPYVLIDRSRCVATVTGTVGFEAICRGVPALVFGDAPYLGCAGAFRVLQPRDVAQYLEEIASGMSIDRGDVERFIAAFEQSPRVVVADSDIDHRRVQAEIIRRMLEYIGVGSPRDSGANDNWIG